MIYSKTLNLNRKGKVLYITFKSFDEFPNIIHSFSTRLGGVSQGIYKSMNLGLNSGDERKNIIRNYKIFSEAIGVNYKDMVLSSQKHGDFIKNIKEEDKGKKVKNPIEEAGVDGLITNIKGIPLTTFYADCVPLYFYDPIKEVIGIAHSGWKGTVLQIGKEMVMKFLNEYGSKGEDILVGIGPSIGKCCFQVGIDVANEFENINIDGVITKDVEDRFKIDLWEANRKILINAGIKEENITITDLCTNCNKETLFSHRGSKGKRGSMIGVIMLK